MGFTDYNDLAIASMGMASQIGTAAMSYGTKEKDRKFNREEAQKQRDFQERMWNQANEYNLPINQMERLKAAGLNPNLVYGDGATTLAAHVGNAAAASAPSTPIQYPNLVQPMLDALQAEKIKAERDLINAEELRTRQDAKKIQEETEDISIDRMWKRDSYQLRLDQLEAENNLKAALEMTETSKRNEIQANIEYINGQRDYYESEMHNRQAITSKEIEKMENDMQNANKITAQTIATMKSEERKYNADAWLASTEAAIKGDPTYKKMAISEKVFTAYKALKDGDQAEIERSLMELQRANMPKVGSAAQEWNFFWNTWVGAPARSIGDALGGSVSFTKKL